MTTHELVTAVKAHALAHYEEGGWDVLVECWDDADMAEVLVEVGATTLEEALAAFAPLVDGWSERQTDARISSGEPG